MRFLPVNLDTMMIELDDLGQTLALLDSLNAEPVEGINELVPAARTILVTFYPGIVSAKEIAANVRARNLTARQASNPTLVEVPVYYVGPDLQEVADMLGVSPQEVIRRHTESEYMVAFTGFAPGFAYMTGGHPSFDIPRKKVPRTRLPAGAVGLAGTFSGVYPHASPGGWQIIGVTPMPMWDIMRDPPSVMQPGFRVRFADAGLLPEGVDIDHVQEHARQQALNQATAQKGAKQADESETCASLEVLATGIQTVFQDLGRFGQAKQGVSASGAMDHNALKTANRLVGNESGAACLESVYGGLKVRAHGHAEVAVTGASSSITLTAPQGRSWLVAAYEPIALNDGDQLAIGTPAEGIRTYMAVRGGFAIPPVLGSCATDTLAHVGPAPLAAGDRLLVKPVAQGAIVGDAQERLYALPKADAVVTLDIVLGPRTDWFTPQALETLCNQFWHVTPQSNRVGIRLSGDVPLERCNHNELPSEGTALGAIQVPSSGQPVLFLADHPLTGGYPVIACVASYHIDLAGQIPVNAQIRFCPISVFSEIDI